MWPFTKKHSVDFQRALDFTLRWEGDYSNDPKDPGGETKFGISKRSYPRLTISKLTKEVASMLYRQDYWEAGKCHEMPSPLNIVHFDACVNLGVARAKRLLQSADRSGSIKGYAVNLIESRRRFYQSITTRSPRFKKYSRGWDNRLNALLKLIKND